MTHSPDHLRRESSRCRKGNTCIYGFPHPITPNTWIDDEGRVHYKRTEEDDRWIASHIPELIDELDCHIHVDVVFTVSVFMYLYKYLFKGPDHTLFRINRGESDQVDEIQDYVNGRYLSAPEASWRILGFDITSKEPSVTCLPVHLPGGNRPQFARGEQIEGSAVSLLIRYFHRPRTPEFSNLLYTEYFEKYVLYPWDPNVPLLRDEHLEEDIPQGPPRRICPRRVGRKVTRIQTLSPTTGEVFYLRCLLSKRPAYDFAELRKINDLTYQTYHEAAIQFGLFSDVNEGYYALQEAVAACQTPGQLRFLFARIVLEGYPAVPLWDEFRDRLAFDHITWTRSHERGVDQALRQIADFLTDSGRRLSDFGLPEPSSRQSAEVVCELDAFEGRHDSLLLQAENMVRNMNEEQQAIYHEITQTIEHPLANEDGNLFFVEGKPGRGKTFLVDAICSRLRGGGQIVLIVGTSALSASLYERGRTAHSLFRIPVKEVRFSTPSCHLRLFCFQSLSPDTILCY